LLKETHGDNGDNRSFAGAQARTLWGIRYMLTNIAQ